MVTISPTLKDHRDALGLSQEQVARRADCSRNHYNLLEIGKHLPRLDLAYRIAGVLETSVVVLWQAGEGE